MQHCTATKWKREMFMDRNEMISKSYSYVENGGYSVYHLCKKDIDWYKLVCA